MSLMQKLRSESRGPAGQNARQRKTRRNAKQTNRDAAETKTDRKGDAATNAASAPNDRRHKNRI